MVSNQLPADPTDQMMRLAVAIQDELSVDAPLLARELFGEKAPGTVQMDDNDVVGMIQRNKTYPSFLQRLAVAVGPDKFSDLAMKAGLNVPQARQSTIGSSPGGVAVPANAAPPVPENSDNPSTDETREIKY